MILATASDDALASCRKLCWESMRRYCALYPSISYAGYVVPPDFGRHPSWFKIRLVRELLHQHDCVMWIDADAVIIGTADLREIIQPVTLNIAKDPNGINCGVMAWRNCSEAFIALDRVDSLYKAFAHHVWFEQAALMTFIGELDVFYQPKAIWNAYGDEVAGVHDVCEETLIVHYPGMSPENRRKVMQARLNQHPVQPGAECKPSSVERLPGAQ